MQHTLFLDVDGQTFARWIEDATQNIWLEPFSLEGAKLSLNRVQRVSRFTSLQTLGMTGYLITQDESEQKSGVISMGEVITFEIIPLGRDRIEVRAECRQPVAEPYFDELILEITKRWPQANAVKVSSAPVKRGQGLNDLPLIISIDEVDSFSFLKTTGNSPRSMATSVQVSEAEVKGLFHDLLGEPFEKRDWGGEQNDIFTSRLVLAGQRRHAAFFLKGPGTRGRLTLAK